MSQSCIWFSIPFSIFYVLFDFSALFLRLSSSNYLHFYFRLSLFDPLLLLFRMNADNVPLFYSRMTRKMVFSAALCSLDIITVRSGVDGSTPWDKPKRTYQYWCTQTPSGVKMMKIGSLCFFVSGFSNVDATTSRQFTACRSVTFFNSRKSNAQQCSINTDCPFFFIVIETRI